VVSPEERIRLLEAFGLTQYEARAYLALLEFGEVRASTVGRKSGISRGNVYQVLDGLQAKGLVEIIPGAPQTYRAVELRRLLDRQAQEARAKADELERTWQAVSSLFPVRSETKAPPGGAYRVYTGRKAVLGRIRAMIAEANREVVCLAPEISLIQLDMTLGGLIDERVPKGLRIRLALPISHLNMGMARSLEPKLELRHHSAVNRMLLLLATDASQAMICRWDVDEVAPTRGHDVAWWSADPEFVQSIREIVMDAWRQSIDPHARYLELTSGRAIQGTATIKGEAELRRAFQFSIDAALREVWISTLASLLERQMPGLLGTYRDIVQRKVRARLLIGLDGGSLRSARELARGGVEVRVWRSLSLGRFTGVDRSHVLIAVGPGDGRPTAESNSEGPRPRYLAIRTADLETVEYLHAAFEFAWDRAEPLTEAVGHSSE
jgi:sugar-specific transcriptional regulator TrmB